MNPMVCVTLVLRVVSFDIPFWPFWKEENTVIFNKCNIKSTHTDYWFPTEDRILHSELSGSGVWISQKASFWLITKQRSAVQGITVMPSGHFPLYQHRFAVQEMGSSQEQWNHTLMAGGCANKKTHTHMNRLCLPLCCSEMRTKTVWHPWMFYTM